MEKYSKKSILKSATLTKEIHREDGYGNPIDDKGKHHIKFHSKSSLVDIREVENWK